MKENLFYYFTNVKLEIKWIPILSDYFSIFHNIIPVFSLYRDFEEMGLSIIIKEVNPEITKIIWKKFRDPSFNKYLTAVFFKGRENWALKKPEIDWRVAKGFSHITIDYNSYVINIPNRYENLEQILLKLAKGELIIFPNAFYDREHTLIL